MIKLEGHSEGNWQTVYKRLVVENVLRNNILAKVALIAERPGFIFVKSIKHGKILEKKLRNAGLNVEFVWGEKNSAQRVQKIEALERAELDFLICSTIFQEGVDVPCLRSVIVGSGGQSIIDTLQRIGRGTRLDKGKNFFEVWDILDLGQSYTKKQAAKRKKTYESEHYNVDVLEEKDLYNLK
jgi:superfamily II DNA or RNA helicase